MVGWESIGLVTVNLKILTAIPDSGSHLFEISVGIYIMKSDFFYFTIFQILMTFISFQNFYNYLQWLSLLKLTNASLPIARGALTDNCCFFKNKVESSSSADYHLLIHSEIKVHKHNFCYAFRETSKLK